MSALSVFDAAVSAWVRGFRLPELTAVMQAFTMLGERPVLFPLVAVVVVAFVFLGKRLHALALTAAMLSGPLFVDVVKSVVGRPRPPATLALIDTPASASFPSGHAFATFLLFGMIAWVVFDSRREGSVPLVAGSFAVVVTSLVGASRVYLGVHWPSDVLASWVLAAVWLGSTVTVTLWLRGQRARVSRSVTEVPDPGREAIETSPPERSTT